MYGTVKEQIQPMKHIPGRTSKWGLTVGNFIFLYTQMHFPPKISTMILKRLRRGEIDQLRPLSGRKMMTIYLALWSNISLLGLL